MDFMAHFRIATGAGILGKGAKSLHAHTLQARLFRGQIGISLAVARHATGASAKNVARKQILSIADRTTSHAKGQKWRGASDPVRDGYRHDLHLDCEGAGLLVILDYR